MNGVVPLRALIVEDVHFLALILDKILSPFGSCDFATTGPEAIKKYSEAYTKEEPYDLICLDILIPKMDGFQVLKNIRNFETKANNGSEFSTKIIVISTFNDEHTVSKAIDAGCDKYISKPFSKNKVLGVVESLGLINPSETPTDTENKQEESK